jgi:hypothetical protein
VSFLRHALVLIHLVAFAALLGGGLVQVRDRVRVVNTAMLTGALVTVASGLLLVGVVEGLGDSVNRAKVATKLALGLVIAVLCWVNRARLDVPAGLFNAVLGLTLVDAGLAVFW